MSNYKKLFKVAQMFDKLLKQSISEIDKKIVKDGIGGIDGPIVSKVIIPRAQKTGQTYNLVGYLKLVPENKKPAKYYSLNKSVFQLWVIIGDSWSRERNEKDYFDFEAETEIKNKFGNVLKNILKELVASYNSDEVTVPEGRQLFEVKIPALVGLKLE